MHNFIEQGFDVIYTELTFYVEHARTHTQYNTYQNVSFRRELYFHLNSRIQILLVEDLIFLWGVMFH